MLSPKQQQKCPIFLSYTRAHESTATSWLFTKCWKIKPIPWIPWRSHFILGEQPLISVSNGVMRYIYLSMKLSFVSFYKSDSVIAQWIPSSRTCACMRGSLGYFRLQYLWLVFPLTHLETTNLLVHVQVPQQEWIKQVPIWKWISQVSPALSSSLHCDNHQDNSWENYCWHSRICKFP